MERNLLRVNSLFDKITFNSTLVNSNRQQIELKTTNQRSCSRKSTKTEVSSRQQCILQQMLFSFLKKQKQVCHRSSSKKLRPIMSTSLLLAVSILITTYLIIAHHSNKHLLTAAQSVSHDTVDSPTLKKVVGPTIKNDQQDALVNSVENGQESKIHFKFPSPGESSGFEPQKMPAAFAYKRKETQKKVHHRKQRNKEEEELLEHLLRAYPSERNQRLIEMLKARQSHYQVFYPAGESDEKGEEEVGSAKDGDDDDDDDDEQVSVNVSETVNDRSAKLINTGKTSAEATTKPTSTSTSTSTSTITAHKLRFQRAPIESSSSKAPQSNSNPNANSNSNSNQNSKANQVLGNYRTNVVIKAFNYKLRLDLELNNNLFGPSLIQKHFLPNGAQQISTQKIEQCYYHARTQPEAKPAAIGAFRTCNGLSGIIHVNNESFVIHPFYNADLNKKHPHIIYRYQSADTQFDLNQSNGSEGRQQQQQQQQAANYRQCGANRLHEWALRQFNKLSPQATSQLNSINRFQRSQSTTNDQGNGCLSNQDSNYNTTNKTCDKQSNNNSNNNQQTTMRFSKRDVSLTEKYIELALILSKDMFDKRNSTFRLEAIHDAIQIINILDLYFRSINTRVALIYLETWAYGDQIEITQDVKQTLYNFLEYSTRKLYKVSMDAIHLLTGGHTKVFDFNEMGMSIPDSICSSRAVSVSQEESIFEPFIASSTMAHMLGHNLGMEHDDYSSTSSANNIAKVAESSSQNFNNHNHNLHQHHHSEAQGIITTTESTVMPIAQPVIDSQKIHHHRQQQQQQQHQEQHQDSGEEHEDEIKSRSLPDDDEQQLDSAAAAEAGAKKSLLRRAIYSQQQQLPDNELPGSDEYCRSNCLMSERFTYLQPPVSIGNMIQQQVATGGLNTNQSLSSPFSSIVTMYNSPDSPTVNLHQQESPQQQLQQQQQQQSLNGPTMNQIDNELQHTDNNNNNNNIISTSLPFKFSRQSVETYHRLLRMGHGICLFNKPNQLEDFKTCGNGIVDKGEDCDCGTFQECLESDSCCDPITCRFKADAECINGACCDRCKLRQKGFICRKARNECDLTEYCDGKSSQCSPDVHKQNGHPCLSGLGYCYLGQCPIHDTQCAQLWGSDAKKADKLCYTTFNINATIRGNCGYDSALRKYKRCDYDNAMCGTLQCQLGDMKPVTASLDLTATTTTTTTLEQQQNSNNNNRGDSNLNLISNLNNFRQFNNNSLVPEFSKKTLHTHDGFHHECKVITGPVVSSTTASSSLNANNIGTSNANLNQFVINSISYVRDGSKCGTNKVCFNQTCQSLEIVYRDAFELCPRDEQGRFCSGNGICSTANRCHCDQNWMGHDCSQRIIINQPDHHHHQQQQQLQQSAIINFTNQNLSTNKNGLSVTNILSPSSSTSTLLPTNIKLVHHYNSSTITPSLPLPPATYSSDDSTSSVVPAVIIMPNPPPINDPQQQQQQQQQQPDLPVNSTQNTLITDAPNSVTTTTTTSAPNPPPPPVVSPSNVTRDKKKETLGASGLVVILVSIVAFVYLGFALMANCYRREGFIKPDKVLRHHQMNCKLDAMRSSFIAKRLADAGVSGNSIPGNFNLEYNPADTNPDLSLVPGMVVDPGVDNSAEIEQQQQQQQQQSSTVDLMNSFPVQSIGTNQANCQHLPPAILFNPNLNPDSSKAAIQMPMNQYSTAAEDGIIGKAHFRPQTFSANPQQQQLSRNSNANSIAATVHYFDDLQRTNTNNNNNSGSSNNNATCIHQQRNAIETFGFEAGSGDHIPLLAADHKPLSRLHFRPTNQLIMRSFNGPQNTDKQQQPQNIYQTQHWTTQQREKLAAGSAIRQPLMNRNHHHHNHTSFQQQKQQQQQQQQQANHQLPSTFSVGGHNRAISRQINRAISLGEVCQQARHGRMMYQEYEDDEMRHSSTAHRALTTPVRSNRANSLRRPCRMNMEDESCSAPSSPDHRDPCWSDAEHNHHHHHLQQQQQHHQQQQAAANMMPGGYSLSRQHSRPRLSAGSRQPVQAAAYHEDAIMGAISASATMMMNQQQQQQSRKNSRLHQNNLSFDKQNNNNQNDIDDDEDNDEDDLPHLPPPPPPPPLMGDDDDDVDDRDDDQDDADGDDEIATEDETDPLPMSSSQSAAQRANQGLIAPRDIKRQSEPLLRSPVHSINSSTNLRTIRRIPLNSGDNGDDTERLSLIAQLQQLERVQSLHQTQVMANDKKFQTLQTSDGLHEFFSLPLSVQLSALLARSLRDVNLREVDMMTPLDDYLNTLNNSSVVASSRRSFKRQSSQQQINNEQQKQQQQQQQQTGSWGQRQQMKLHNLQGLINRLQKLHSQTMLQQQLDELNGELNDDDVVQRGSRQSTLSRGSGRASRSASRAANQIADDLVGGGWSRSGSGSGSGSRINAKVARRAAGEASIGGGGTNNNKNESVYSMSDSEDGSGVYLSYQQKLENTKSTGGGGGSSSGGAVTKQQRGSQRSDQVVDQASSYVQTNNNHTTERQQQQQHQEQPDQQQENQRQPQQHTQLSSSASANGAESQITTNQTTACVSDTTDQVEEAAEAITTTNNGQVEEGSTKCLQTDV